MTADQATAIIAELHTISWSLAALCMIVALSGLYRSRKD